MALGRDARLSRPYHTYRRMPKSTVQKVSVGCRNVIALLNWRPEIGLAEAEGGGRRDGITRPCLLAATLEEETFGWTFSSSELGTFGLLLETAAPLQILCV